jgi:hypothetical protein
VAADGGMVEVRPGGALAAKAFRVRLINFQGSAKVKDDDLKQLVGLAELHELATLQEIRLDKTRVTEAGLGQLQKALPRCKIATK